MLYQIQTIQASQDLTPDEIKQAINPEILEQLKAKDDSPFLKAFAIAHEGESEPVVLDDNGNKSTEKIFWDRGAIQSIKQHLKNGIKFFMGHNKDNSTDGRESFGEIVGAGEKEIDDKLNSFVIGYFPPEHREQAEKTKSVSMEAVWSFFQRAGKTFADGVKSLSGIALAPDGVATAFKNSVQLGSIQAYSEEIEMTQTIEIKPEDIPFHVLIEAVKKKRAYITQIWTPQEIMGTIKLKDGQLSFEGGDRDIQSLLVDKIGGPINDFYEQHKDYADLKANNEKMKIVQDRIEAKPKAMEALKDQPEHIKKLAEVNFDKFEMKNSVDDTVKSFVESMQDEAEKLEKIGLAPAGSGAQVNNPPEGEDKEEHKFLWET